MPVYPAGTRNASSSCASFLLALDFCGVTEVVSQPFRLRAGTTAGWREHIPDFLAVTGDGVLLADIRPRDLIRDDDRLLFAAAAEAALSAGWNYSVIVGRAGDRPVHGRFTAAG